MLDATGLRLIPDDSKKLYQAMLKCMNGKRNDACLDALCHAIAIISIDKYNDKDLEEFLPILNENIKLIRKQFKLGIGERFEY